MDHSKHILFYQQNLKICLLVIEKYKSLLDTYLVEYFSANLENQLPCSWREQLENVSPDCLGRWIDFEKTDRVFPLSLLALRCVVQTYSVSRQPDIIKAPILKLSDKRAVLLTHTKLKYAFFRGVNPKKQYEILRIAKLTSELASQSEIKHVVDVGSGLGHLSRVLAYGFGLKVCCLETKLELSEQARILDNNLECTLGKHFYNELMKNMESSKPVHLNKTIDFNTTPEELTLMLETVFGVKDSFQFGIVGLHPCGDLTAVLLRLFINCPSVAFINIIGCCYHKLTPRTISGNHGYPLSQISNKIAFDVSYEARGLGSHAIEAYKERLKSKDYQHLKIHCYRATLETIIKQKWPQYQRYGLCNVNHKHQLNFSQYCEIALKKLKLEVDANDTESESVLKCLSKWDNVVVYYSLRLLIAPLVETAMLYDRMVYLLENGADCELIAAFDPKISPRNQVMMAWKRKPRLN